MNIFAEIGYLDAAGFRALPANRAQKRPTGKWGKFRGYAPGQGELAALAHLADAVCILMGACSGNAETLDFDNPVYWEKWRSSMDEQRPDLLGRLLIERTQNGGHHVIYRCSEIAGNQKLAKERIPVDGPGEWPTGYGSKKAKAVQLGGAWFIEPCLIETRGEDGLILCAPSPGYVFEQGDPMDDITVTPEERGVMLSLARSFSAVEVHETPKRELTGKAPDFSGPHPHDQFNRSAELQEVIDLLEEGGWSSAGENSGRLCFSRPGKSEGTSGTLTKDAPHIFWNFSENADLPTKKGITPFDLLVAYRHDGDREAALKDLEERGFTFRMPPELGEVTEETVDTLVMPPDPEENFVAWLNQDHALTTIGGKVVIIKEREDGGLDLLRRADFETLMLKHRVPVQVEDKKGNISIKYEPASKIWLGSKERRESKGVCFRPDGCPDGHTNMWRGFAMEPNPDDERCAKYRWHVENIICGGNPDIIRYVWAWLADIIQRPGNKPGVAIALKGGKGVGKGMFAQPILKILGRHAIQIQSRDLFIGRFNGHMADKVFVFLDEAYWHGDKAAEGKLKGFITEPTLPIEQKGIDAYTVDSFHRVLIASNEAHVVPAGMDERRFLVLDVKDDRQQDKAYFGALAQEMKNGGVEALMSWLGRYDYKGVELRTAPNTAALMGQKLRSLEPHAAFWLECLHQGSIDGFTPWPEYVRMREVHGLYLRFCQQSNVTRYPLTLRVFVDTLFGERGLAPKSGMKKTWSKEKQFRQHRIPSLDECRDLFDKAMKSSYPWEEPENGLDDL